MFHIEDFILYFETQMKNLLKIWALSLALIATVFMLNTNAQTTDSGDVQLKIEPLAATCTYGTAVDLGATGFSYSAQVMSTGFLNSLGGPTRYCEDTEGDATRALSIQMLTNLVNMDNGSYNIPEANVLITNPAATTSSGTCTADATSNTDTSIANATELFGKASAISEICTITTANVGIKVNVPAAQQVGAYSGTIQVSYDATLGNGLMN